MSLTNVCMVDLDEPTEAAGRELDYSSGMAAPQLTAAGTKPLSCFALACDASAT
jgi:hypothetical protein